MKPDKWTRRDLAVVLVVTAGLSAAALSGLPQALGAHPWWAARSGIIGSILGAATCLTLRGIGWPWKRMTTLSLVGLALSIIAVIEGKRLFALSYGQDTLAGRFWYIGWFAVAASLCLLLVTLVVRRR